jgi:hypothetical protein
MDFKEKGLMNWVMHHQILWKYLFMVYLMALSTVQTA